ncbi:hypothetical protein DFH09DRAFT_1092335 [Mycena vulgaris]|nr:hypothetical protein DFH09DRAFT_1092335 [Mycena vulgaris]
MIAYPAREAGEGESEPDRVSYAAALVRGSRQGRTDVHVCDQESLEEGVAVARRVCKAEDVGGAIVTAGFPEQQRQYEEDRARGDNGPVCDKESLEDGGRPRRVCEAEDAGEVEGARCSSCERGPHRQLPPPRAKALFPLSRENPPSIVMIPLPHHEYQYAHRVRAARVEQRRAVMRGVSSLRLQKAVLEGGHCPVGGEGVQPLVLSEARRRSARHADDVSTLLLGAATTALQQPQRVLRRRE